MITCRKCNIRPEEYRAVGNIPEYAHLCYPYWLSSPDNIRFHYVSVGLGQFRKTRSKHLDPLNGSQFVDKDGNIIYED